MTWNECYALARTYYLHYGNLDIKTSFKTKNGYEYDESGEWLGRWINSQKHLNKLNKLTEIRKKMLVEIGFNFDNIHDLQWEKMYQLALAYYQHHKNLDIKTNFITSNGYEYDTEGKNLGDWLRRQRAQYKNGTLSKERINKLLEIGIIFENCNDTRWEQMYKLAQVYYEKHGHLLVSADFKTVDGYQSDSNGKNLGDWIHVQRLNYEKNKLSIERITKLEKIGMKFTFIREVKWEKMFLLAEAYYRYYGNLNIPSSFKTKNGYEYDENGDKLGCWINIQRKMYKSKKITPERLHKLEMLDMIFENFKDTQWEKMYEIAKIYHEHYRNLRVKVGFRTSNGYKYDENGKHLGVWIADQRQNYREGKLSNERIERLKLIGMIFEVHKNQKLNELLCEKYNIDYDLQKQEIDSIPNREFLAKINYLNSKQIPIQLENYLHPIFFESNINLEVRYGISLEQLINQYTISKDKVKRL